MQRRSFWTRTFATLWLLWFSLAAIEPAAVHSCPVHDDHAQMPGMAHVHGAMAHDAMSPDAMAEETPNQPSPQHDDRHDVCSCIGTSCGATTGAFLAASIDVPIAVAVPAIATRDFPRVARVAASASRYLQPFANGPPATSLQLDSRTV